MMGRTDWTACCELKNHRWERRSSSLRLQGSTMKPFLGLGARDP